MSSTRSKNTIGNYKAEQWSLKQQSEYMPYSSYAAPPNTYFCGDGLIGAKVGPLQLSDNFCDIESSLFGIGSTNLVLPQPDVVPEIKKLKSLSIIDKLPVIFPSPLVVEPNQRQRFLH
jgi:hypothetical protein